MKENEKRVRDFYEATIPGHRERGITVLRERRQANGTRNAAFNTGSLSIR
jgi:hypothetical protein